MGELLNKIADICKNTYIFKKGINCCKMCKNWLHDNNIHWLFDLIKNLFIYKLIAHHYKIIRHWLAKHKSVPYIFAHGGLHFFVLIFLIFLASIMYIHIINSNVASFSQSVYTFYGDTLNNYKLTYLYFEKDLTRHNEFNYSTHDRILKYGFTRIVDKDKIKKINPINRNDTVGNCDLVSKLKYVTRNDIKETNNINKKTRSIFSPTTNQIRRTEIVSDHERYYYGFSLLKDSTHLFGHSFGSDILNFIESGTLNPVFNVWIGIVTKGPTDLDDKSVIKIKMNNIDTENATDGIMKPLLIEKVIPQPTYLLVNEIIYKGEELKNVIRQKGIYISGVDSIKKDEIEQRNIKYTVFLGTIIAFMLDIFIQLILKWRKLKEPNK